MIVPDLGLLPYRSLVWSWFLSLLGPCSVDAADSAYPEEVTGSGLLTQRSLAWACSGEGPWLRPATTDIPGSGLVPLRLLAWAWSCGSFWLCSVPRRLLTRAQSCRGHLRMLICFTNLNLFIYLCVLGEWTWHTCMDFTSSM